MSFNLFQFIKIQRYQEIGRGIKIILTIFFKSPYLQVLSQKGQRAMNRILKEL